LAVRKRKPRPDGGPGNCIPKVVSPGFVVGFERRPWQASMMADDPGWREGGVVIEPALGRDRLSVIECGRVAILRGRRDPAARAVERGAISNRMISNRMISNRMVGRRMVLNGMVG